MKIGYARVSTIGQDIETQREILEEYGCEKVFVEKITGTSTAQRLKLQEAMDFVREGDVLVVTKIDRLARSIIDLNKIVSSLREKNVSLHFIKDNMYFEAGEEASSMQTLLFNILGSFAQFERDLIVERTTEGRVRATKSGKHMGRPGQDEKDIKRAIKMYDSRQQSQMSVSDIVRATGVPKSTLYHKLKQQQSANNMEIEE